MYEALSYRNGLELQAPSIIVCMAIMQQQYVAAKYLICIMCVYITPKDGYTPIYVAAAQGKTDAMKELISAGCDINLAAKVKQMTRLALALALRAFRARLPLAPLSKISLENT